MIRLEVELRSTTVSPLIITSARSLDLPVRAEEPEMKVLLALTFLLAFLALGLSEPDSDRDVELVRDQLGVREKREPTGGKKKGRKTGKTTKNKRKSRKNPEKKMQERGKNNKNKRKGRNRKRNETKRKRGDKKKNRQR